MARQLRGTRTCHPRACGRPLAPPEAAGTGGERTQIFVHLEQDLLGPDGQLAATLEDGGRVSAETLRRLACDAGLVPVLVDDRGRPLDVGRKTRSIPPAIRRALRVRDGTCQFPSCSNSLYVHGHHIDHWMEGGETKLDNVILLCAAHHHLVHEGGFSVERDEDGEVRFMGPDDEAIPRAWVQKDTDGASVVAWTDGLGITAGTSLCKGSWGGFDLSVAVGAVVGPRRSTGVAGGAEVS